MRRLSKDKLIKFGLVLFVLTIPLQNRDIFNFFGTRLFPPRLVLLGLIVASLFSLLSTIVPLNKNLKQSFMSWRKKVGGDSFFGALAILWLIRFLSLSQSLNIRASLSLLLFYTSMIALYLILRFVREKDHHFVLYLFKVHLFAVAAIGFFALIQLLLSPLGIRLPGVLLGSTFIRVPATFYDANHLPPYLLTGLPFLMAYSFFTKSHKTKILLYFLVALISIVIFFTFSRSGAISLLVVLLIFCLYFAKNHYWRKLGFVFVIVSLIILVVYLTDQTNLSLVRRASSVFNLQDKSTVAHGILLYGGIKIWLDHPLLGVGYGGFSEAFRLTALGREHALFDPATSVRLPIHSLWLEVLAETGIVGFAAYLYLILLVFEKITKTLRQTQNRKLRLYLVSLFCSYLGILAGGVFYSYNQEFFWFYIFFVYFYCQIVSREKKSEALTVGEDLDEGLNWKELRVVSVLVLLAFPLLTVNLAFPYLDPRREAIDALIAKTIHRSWTVGDKFWWIPRLDGNYYFSKPPLLYWLSAFTIYLYDILSSAVRFWPAFLGFLSVLTLFFLVRHRFGSARALLASLVYLSFPGLLPVFRRATFEPFYSLLILMTWLSILVVRRRKSGFLVIGLVLSLAFLIDQRAGLVASVLLAILMLVDTFFGGNGWRYRTPWLLTALLSIAFLNLPWILYGSLNFKSDFYRGYFSGTAIPNPRMIYLILAPSLAVFLSRYLSGRALRPCLWLFSLLAVFQLYGIPQSANQETIHLIEKRLESDRRGTVPLVMVGKKSYDYAYYSEVPIVYVEDPYALDKFLEDRAYFFIMDGRKFREISSQLALLNKGTRVIWSEGESVLVEKFGFVP